MVAPGETVRVDAILKVQVSPAAPVIVTGAVIVAAPKQKTGLVAQLIGLKADISGLTGVLVQPNPLRAVK
jgi:hypothetical protein